MQLFALDDTSLLIATQAHSHRPYQCPECGGTVFLRQGSHTQPHFYHKSRPLICRQHRKSPLHLLAQEVLLTLLPQGEAIMEYRVPGSSRIADVAWLPQHIVFEIQCSPIALDEVEARIADYRFHGFFVVWILHEGRFNQKRLSAAEQLLRNEHTCYYFRKAGNKQMFFYDQWDVSILNTRRFKGPPLRVLLSKPIAPPSHLPVQRPLCFQGDLLDELSRQPPATLEYLTKRRESFTRRLFLKGLRIQVKQLYIRLLDRMITHFSQRFP